MLFLPSEDLSLYVPTLKFYCGVTCLYFPLITLSILCTDLVYQTGKLSFLPLISLMALFELAKYIYIAVRYRDSEKCSSRHNHKSSGIACKKWFTEKRLKDIVKGTLLVCFITFAYYTIAILFGAELFSKFEETFMFSILLSVLTALPPCLYMGPNHALGVFLGESGCFASPLNPILQHVVRFTLLGAWLGAFVIPLDWDRPWQKWPVPCCVGALMGYVASHATAMIEIALPRYVRNMLANKLK